MKINKETTLDELLKDPKMVEVLAKYNLPCLSCPFAKMEMENLKIGDVCKTYGVDCKNLIEDLSKACKK